MRGRLPILTFLALKNRKENTWKLMVRGHESLTMSRIIRVYRFIAMKTLISRFAVLAVGLAAFLQAHAAEGAAGLKVLLLGDRAGHRPIEFFKVIGPALQKKNIEVVYTEDLADLNAGKLAGFDALMIF